MTTLTRAPRNGDIGPVRRKIDLEPLEEPLPATPAPAPEPAKVPEPVK
jgi:hypothetical protein